MLPDGGLHTEFLAEFRRMRRHHRKILSYRILHVRKNPSEWILLVDFTIFPVWKGNLNFLWRASV